MTVDNSLITVMSTMAGSFELRVNNKSFTHMLNQERTNKEFVRGTQQCQDFVLDSKLTQSSKG
jgi:hypothetical protein